MHITIRPFKKTDTPLLIQLFHETVHAIGSRYYSAEQIDAWAPMHTYTEEQKNADLERRCAKFEAHITLVAEINDRIVGFADMTDQGYLDHVYVHADYQAQGIAYRLFKALETIALQKKIETIFTHASVMAMPLALRIGFKITLEETIIHRGVAIKRYKMEKKLN